jgi:hypothetical protein
MVDETAWTGVTLTYRSDKFAEPDVHSVPEAVGIVQTERLGPAPDEVRAEMLAAIAPEPLRRRRQALRVQLGIA